MKMGQQDTGTREVEVMADGLRLPGNLTIPRGAYGLVLFAHGSGSSRHSPRNRYVAGMLNEAGLATLLFDLLTTDEELVDRRTAHLRFDIDLLARRLKGAAGWLAGQPLTQHLRTGFFGSSTGAAAALVAAAEQPAMVHALVSRGGRPDLAGPMLPLVEAPTLLLVGGYDADVLALNQNARDRMTCRVKLVVVPGATHLFEEPGTLAQVAHLAAEWFAQYLRPPDDRNKR